MNKRDLSFLGGDPDRIDDDEFSQNALTQAISGLASVWQYGSLDPIILSGLVGTVGVTHTVYTPGYIVVNSEVYYVSGGTFLNGSALGINIDPTFDSNGDKVFENLNTHQTYIIRQGILKILSGGDFDIADFVSLSQRLVKITSCVVNASTAWVNVPFQGTWTSSGGSYGTTRYRKNAIGNVELDGSINNLDTSTGNLICQLPAGFRPTKKYTLIVAAEINSVATFARILIESTGDVTYLSSSTDVVYYLCLGNISFPIT